MQPRGGGNWLRRFAGKFGKTACHLDQGDVVREAERLFVCFGPGSGRRSGWDVFRKLLMSLISASPGGVNIQIRFTLDHIGAYSFLIDEGRGDEWFGLSADDFEFVSTPALGTVLIRDQDAFREFVIDRYIKGGKTSPAAPHQAMRSASRGRLAPSEVSSIVAGIIRSLGVPAEEADRITAKSGLPLPKDASRDAANPQVGKDVTNPNGTE